MFTKLQSKIDQSVNFVYKIADGAFESRYVRREPDYFSCYLSSHAGCNKGCKFCHLTQKKELSMTQVTGSMLYAQAQQVLEHYYTQPKALRVHINFMARGEALCNSYLSAGAFRELALMFQEENLTPRFNISTIMPKGLILSDLLRFSPINPVIYYSLWSIDEEWRREWMPAAMPPTRALNMLEEYQKATGAIVKVHGAFIKGQNSIPAGWLAPWAQRLHMEFNVVRYNPFSEELGEESELEPILQGLRLYGIKTKIVERVGFDTNASCGMFSTE